MIKKLLFLFLIYFTHSAYADTIKTDVLVIGGSASGTAAAIQCARSKVKTLLVEPGPWLGGTMTAGGMCVLTANSDMPGGIWGEFRKKVMQFYSKVPGYDTTANAALRFEPFTGASILKKLTDTVKNLTVRMNTNWTNVKKDGTGWEVSILLAEKLTTVKAQVLVDATEFGDVVAKAGAIMTSGTEGRGDTGEKLAPENATNIIRDITWPLIVKDYGAAADRTIAKPAGYDPSLYTCLKAADVKRILAEGRLPNDKFLLNTCANTYHVYPDDLSPDKREDYFKTFRERTLGLLYYVQTTLKYKNLGVDDEFNTPDNLPYIPYVREYRHVKGQVRMVLDDILKPYNRESKLYRTSIGVSDAAPDITSAGIAYPPFPAFSIPMGAVIVKDMDNLLVTEKAISVTHLANAGTCDPAVQMVLGQGAGTVAAYCAFFKTTTQKLNVRIIQGELLDFKGYLLPLSDIKFTDPDFRAIQQVAATGLLESIPVPTADHRVKLCFAPDSAVRTSEVKPVLNEIYTRGFLWFNKFKPGEYFTVDNLMNLVSDITLSDPKTLETTLRNQWKTVYKFKDDYNPNRPATRREFAVLTNKYLNPFARRVDIAGRLLN
ncbi:FAD-dependent oxidoreductase [Mucilaginibacter sp. RS28]|uniref:FAD-dependent oxidoreductase n=1 Tax=Mucilaginibacter straminoryzae TaxID=2932774 RepID=A0A9X1X727_9SPHI|nr:FAD-dependent oxidoreductase [Mucilaginibacter straminoryzae]MCJ8211776.1 FAD-dependent oxidoreductase [Mucilaginibacter straminoryzae]